MSFFLLFLCKSRDMSKLMRPTEVLILVTDKKDFNMNMVFFMFFFMFFFLFLN